MQDESSSFGIFFNILNAMWSGDEVHNQDVA